MSVDLRRRPAGRRAVPEVALTPSDTPTGTAPKAPTRGRPVTGNVESVPLKDVTVCIRARFRHQGCRYLIVFGRDVEGWTKERGTHELTQVYVLLAAGVPIEKVLARQGAPPLQGV